MLLNEVWPNSCHMATEALGRWGTLAAALGMGGMSAVMGAGANPGSQLGHAERLNLDAPVPLGAVPHIATSATQVHTPTPTATPSTPRMPQTGGVPHVHAQFPRELHNVHLMQPNQRVATFVMTLAPLIQQENDRIQRNRTRVQQIVRNRASTTQDQAWLQDQIKLYNAQDARDLLTRMDQIPVSLVLAQAAIESGWGQDQIARSGNAFFGQRATRTQAHILGPQGERYRLYDDPRDSIRSYMHNLNSHPAYQSLRHMRVRARMNQQPLRGKDLAPGLMSYSTRGADYVRQVQRLIQQRQLHRFD